MAKSIVQRAFRDGRVLAVYERLRESPLFWPVVGRTLGQEVGDALAAIDRAGPGDVLDLACGQGTFSVAVARARPGRRVVGLDLSAPQIARAVRRAAGEAGFVVGDATALPFRDESFAGAMSFTGLHQIPDHDAVAREVARVLRPGGVFYGATFSRRGGPGRIRARTQAAIGVRPIEAYAWARFLARAGLADFRYSQRTPLWGVFEATRT
jgi:ubiquinone/menaquinone biosynthesis C-methylase UbiE